MIKPTVKLRVQNGLTFNGFKKEVFDINHISDDFNFEESENPDFIIFGPYGNNIPPPGNYIRIGYFCENIAPDLSLCDWAFGIPREDEINDPRYKRIQWHGVDPNSLIKKIDDNEIDRIMNMHTGFCNFIYSHPVTYRDEFFKQLNKYKRIDAPGKSMNNMPSIDTLYSGDMWQRKREFLGRYKFTIAFENYCYPGYQTEKLYDPMLANSIPIYCGDPFAGEIFNVNSFINARDYIKTNAQGTVSFLERISQLNFKDIRPQFYRSPNDRIRRKLKYWGRGLKMKLQFNKLDFSDLIDKIIDIDKDPDVYKKYLNEPWLRNNSAESIHTSQMQWRKIFS